MEIEDEVIRHEVVGGDHGDAELFGSPDQGAPYKEMALGVHHVRADTPYLLEDVAEEEGRRGEAEARVEGHGQRARPALDHPSRVITPLHKLLEGQSTWTSWPLSENATARRLVK